MATELDSAYDYCQRLTRSEAKNFYYAFRTLPSQRRRAIYAIYAFCRLCDDVADEDQPLDEKRRLLAQIRDDLERSGSDAGPEPIFTALGDARERFAIPTRYFADVIDGVEMDLAQDRYENFYELRRYCYKVASAVGLACVEVFGYTDVRTKQYAIDLGVAMQLTNILRDLKEDAQRGRIYVPLDEIEASGYSERELLDGEVNDAFRDLMASQVRRARHYFASGSRLIPFIAPQSRACPAVLIGVYGAILDRIEASGFDVYSGRIGLSTAEKLLLMARLWATSLIPMAFPPRR